MGLENKGTGQEYQIEKGDKSLGVIAGRAVRAAGPPARATLRGFRAENAGRRLRLHTGM